MKKNNNLLRNILVCFLLCVLLSWVIPVGTISDGTVSTSSIKPIGLFGLIYVPVITIATFVQYAVVILALGGFYGVLNKTGVYSKLVNSIAKKYDKKEKLFLIITITTIMILASVLGNPYGLLVFVPFLMGIILKLGYNKITAVAATIGSILAGSVASTYGLNVATQIANTFSIDVHNGIMPKFAFLSIVTVLYVLFVCGHKQTVIEKPFKMINDGNKEKKAFIRIKIPFAEEKFENKKNVKPLIIIFALLAVFLFFSMTNWQYMFKVTLFNDLFDKIGNIKLGEVAIVKSILGSDNPFGYWTSYELAATLLLFSLLTGWIYGLNFDETCHAFGEGVKRIGKTAFIMTLASIVFTVMLMGSGNTMFITITDKLLSLTKDFFFLTTSATGLINGFFYNDFYYGLSSVADLFLSKYNEGILPIVGYIYQTMHGIMMLIMPTSVILVGGLSLLDVPFKDWIKYIFMFVLQLLVLSIVISIGLVLMV